MKSLAPLTKSVVFYSLLLFLLLILTNPLAYFRKMQEEPMISYEISGNSSDYVVNFSNSKNTKTSLVIDPDREDVRE